MRIKLFSILFCLSCSILSAGTNPKINFPLNGNLFISTTTNSISYPTTHTSFAGVFTDPEWTAYSNSPTEFYSFSNTLELYQYESTDLPVNFEYDLKVTGTLSYTLIGGVAPAPTQITLHINNKFEGESRRIDFYTYSNAFKSSFEITSVTAVLLNGTLPTGSDINTEVGKLVELNFGITQTHFKQREAFVPVPPLNSACYDNLSKELVIKWPPILYAEDYELEILYVDDYSENSIPLNPADIHYDFTENATRIVLTKTFYRLPIVYDRGWILYRIRGIGRGGPLWDKRIPGPWSMGTLSGNVSGFPAKYHVSAFAAQTRNKINWQVTTTYADEGKRKDVVQYSDGLYMTRQTITGVSQIKNVFTSNVMDNTDTRINRDLGDGIIRNNHRLNDVYSDESAVKVDKKRENYQKKQLKIDSYPTSKTNQEKQSKTIVKEQNQTKALNLTNYADRLTTPCASYGGDKIKEIIAQENIYDFNGRVGVQIMPSPTGKHIIDYIPHLNQNLAGVPYSWKDFDYLTSCNLTSNPLKQNAAGAIGAGEYYSPNNPNKIGYNAFIPNAFGYPFSRVQYLDENTGKVARQGGVGSGFQLDGTHETKFFYGTPEQVELDRMFGTEVGYAARYLKKMVVDPNGQTSVTYENPEGKTIATALTGVKPDNLQTLDNEPQNLVEIDVDVMGDSIIDSSNHSKSINKQFLVPATGVYKFNYTVNGQHLDYKTCQNNNICLDCIYDLSFVLRANDGCTTVPIPPFSGTFGDLITQSHLPNINQACFDSNDINFESKPPNFPVGFNLTLTQGSYTLEKTLTVNRNAAEAYVNLVYKDTCKALWDTILKQEIDNIDTSGCNQTCASCQNTSANPTIECFDICAEPLNDCEMARKMMLADLNPGGQYAQYSVNSNGIYYSNDPLSIFNPTNQLHSTPTSITINGHSISDPLYINDFINNWGLRIDAAAETTLLLSHPEHCMLEWCELHNPGKEYDLSLRTATTFDAAVASHLINDPSAGPAGTPNSTYKWMLIHDPFFVAGSSNYNSFLTYMNNMCPPQNLNLMQLAMQAAFCGSGANISTLVSGILSNPTATINMATATVPPCVLPANYLTDPTVHQFGNDPATKDAEWKMLRDLYLSFKEKYLYQSRLAFSLSSNCYNGCIGNDNYFYSSISGNSYSFEGSFNVSAQSPCGINNLLYEHKVKRFSNRYDAYGHTSSTTPVNLTGINLYNDCPTLADVTNTQSQIQTIVDKTLCNSDTVIVAPKPCLLNEILNMLNENLPNDNPQHTTTLDSVHIPPTIRNLYGIGNKTISQVKIVQNNSDYTISFYSGTGVRINNECSISFHLPDSLRGLILSNVCCPTGFQSLNGYNTLAIKATFNNGISRYIHLQSKCLWLSPCDSKTSISSSAAIIHSGAVSDSSNIATKKKYTNVTPLDIKVVKSHNDFKEEVRKRDRFVNQISKTDTCKSLSPFANELFSLLKDLKNPQFPRNGRYTYTGAKSALYTLFNPITPVKYDFATLPNCTLTFSGESVRGRMLLFCTITFESFIWMAPEVSLVSVKPYIESGIPQTRKFLLTYRNNNTNQLFQTTGTSNCLPLTECKPPTLCGDSLLKMPSDSVHFNGCIESKYLMAHQNAESKYERLIDSLSKDLLQKYYAKCMRVTEALGYKYEDKQFHYTLYYYDQAGNLTRTVPPSGVRLLPTTASIGISGIDYLRDHHQDYTSGPNHSFLTNYAYNSLNQLKWQTTPDAGLSTFFYDKLGRIAASQNAKQQPQNNYSYTYYDLLGRTVESGELMLGTVLNPTIVKNYNGWKSFLFSYPRRDITFTQYDNSFHPPSINNKFGPSGQQNLRGRVASILSFEDNAKQASNTYRHATHYTYDVSGNVPVLIQDYPTINALEPNLGDKVIAYNFDLVSGKVNEVRYEPGLVDEFRHKYTYDDELRLTKVQTSRKGIIWETEAEYFYYKHGPLARTELGQLKVQGLDYLYTLQGWIKGVNGTDSTVQEDAGRDGIALEQPMAGTANINGQTVSINVETNSTLNTTGEGFHTRHSTVAKDAFSYVLSYYNGDYSPIGTANLNTTVSMNVTIPSPLYNGNISRMYTRLQTLGGLGMNYTYDQLNRLKTQTGFTVTNPTTHTLLDNDAYAMALTYDGNGNILKLKRNGNIDNPKMDDLSYNYYKDDQTLIPDMANPPINATNRLASVNDNPAFSGNYPETGTMVNGTVTDVDNQTNQYNYTYDAIGNLTSDESENIKTIEWNLQNKITRIKKTGTDASKLFYEYDALGNRVSKNYLKNGTSTKTFYVCDATGNIMGTYQYKDNILKWQEQDLYGSSRLGIWKPNQKMLLKQHPWTGFIDWQNLGLH